MHDDKSHFGAQNLSRVARGGEVVVEHPDGCNQAFAAASTRNAVKTNPFILSTSVVCFGGWPSLMCHVGH